MCYIFSCFGWLVDLVQRVITFALACWMSCAVCLGLAVAAVTGIAYGYNYQMAEWLTFTRSDVTVYMRRGQFYDRPDVKPNYISRRSGADDDVFQQHVGGEDEYVAPEWAPPEGSNPTNAEKSLSDSWSGISNAGHLMNKIRKFNKEAVGVGPTQDDTVQVDTMTQSTPLEYYKLTTPPSQAQTKLISITPNSVLPTAIFNNGDAKIIMRNFQVSTMKNIDPDSYKSYSGDYIDRDEIIESKHGKDYEKYFDVPKKDKMRPTLSPDFRIREDEPVRSSSVTMVMRHWGTSSTPMFQDYTNEVDEDSIVYKPG